MHGALGLKALRWLPFLADPLCAARRPAGAVPFTQADGIVEAAIHHGVLPAVLRRLRSDRELRSGPAGPAPYAADALLRMTGHALLLAHHGGRVAAAFARAGIPAVIVKGPTFAKRLYPDPSLRPFGDIDILVPDAGLPETRRMMPELGFRTADEGKRRGLDYHEEQWTLDGRPEILIEIQDDLVHAPSLRKMSLDFQTLSDAGGGDAQAATALLLTAAVHGGIGHQFDRLRFLVDICQAARGAAGPIDSARLVDATKRSGTLMAVAAGLDLAARLFDEPAALRLADTLARSPLRRFVGALLPPHLVLRAQGPERARDSWRRKAAREIFKRASPT
jgi:hypothetical protein